MRRPMSSDAFLIPFYRPVGDERRAVDTPAHIRCRVIISLGRGGERGRAGANEAAALKECDRLTEKPSKDLLWCSRAFGRAGRLRADVADAFKPFLCAALHPLVLTAY